MPVHRYVVFALFASAPAFADPYVFTVGAEPLIGEPGGACSSHTLQGAIDQAKAREGFDLIHVANDQAYREQALSLSDQEVQIVGGYASCTQSNDQQAPSAGRTELNGAGGASAPVLRVRGKVALELRNLELWDGDNPGGDGGGIDFEGRGAINLFDTAVVRNRARNGGGIHVKSSGGLARLEMHEDNVVEANSAVENGGGIHLDADARLAMIGPRQMLYGNFAPDGAGGALYVHDRAHAEIASAGVAPHGTIAANVAHNGGGIALQATLAGKPTLELYSVTGEPTVVTGNVADYAGGAIHGRGRVDCSLFGAEQGRRVDVFLRDFQMVSNRAHTGGAITLDSDYDADCSDYAESGYLDIASERCPAGGLCNRIDGNVSPGGAVLDLGSGAAVSADRFTLVNNQAYRLLFAWPRRSSLDAVYRFSNCIAVKNTLQNSLFETANQTGNPAHDLQLEGCTVADNVQGDAVLELGANGRLDAAANVLQAPSARRVAKAPAILSRYNVVSDVESFAGDDTSYVGKAEFFDEDFGDYRLRPGSPAIDRAPAQDVAGDHDYLLSARDEPVAMQPDVHGPRDAGGIEMAPHDELVVNGGFAGDLRTWRLNREQYADVSRRPDGSADAGALSASLGPYGSLAAASYCVSLPAPGAYLLGANALVSETGLQGDFAEIEFQVFEARGCNGPSILAGRMPFGVEPGWMHREQLATMPASGASVKLALVVRESGHDAANRVARFDNVSLRKLAEQPELPARVFYDGFD